MLTGLSKIIPISKWIPVTGQRYSDFFAYILYLRPGKSSKGVGTVRSGNQTGLSEVVLGLQVPDLGIVRAVDNTDGDGENGVALDTVTRWAISSGVLGISLRQKSTVATPGGRSR